MLRSLLEQGSKLIIKMEKTFISLCCRGEGHMRTLCLLRTLSLHSYLAKHLSPPREREAISAEHRETGVLSASYYESQSSSSPT